MAKKKTKKKSNNNFIKIFVSIVLILMIAGVFYYFYETNKKEAFDVSKVNYYKYNGFDFTREGNYWVTLIQFKKQPFNVKLSFSPVEVYNVSVNYSNDHLFTAYTAKLKPVYIAFDPTNENQAYVAIGSANIAFALSKVYGLNVSGACLVNDSACTNVPVLNCSKNVDGLVIVLNNTGKTGLVYKDNCLFVNGEGKELDRAVSRATLEWYGILKVNETTQKIMKPIITDYK